MSSQLIISALDVLPSLESSTESKTILSNPYFLSQELSDIWVVTKDQTIAAHKVFLGAKSSVLANKFKQIPDLKEWSVNGVDTQAIIQMIQFVYTNQYICSQNLLIEMDVLTLAHKCQIFDLSLLVEEGIEQMLENNNHLNFENFKLSYKFGIDYNLKKFLDKTIAFGELNKIAILELELLRSESKESIEEIIKILGLTQTQIIHSITKSLIQNPNRNKEVFKVLIDLNICSIEDLFCLAKTNLFVNENLLERIENKYKEEKQYFEDIRRNYFEVKQALDSLAQTLCFRN